MQNDQRIGTVSFLSNAAGALSFPHRNSPTPMGFLEWMSLVSVERFVMRRLTVARYHYRFQ